MFILGRYREIYKDQSLPSIFDNISGKECEQKAKILKYLRKENLITSASPARISDVISGEPINTELTCSSDGEYGWRSDVPYYVEKYNLQLPKEFVKHVLS